jgi:hypothetical protein
MEVLLPNLQMGWQEKLKKGRPICHNPTFAIAKLPLARIWNNQAIVRILGNAKKQQETFGMIALA